ncbi:MAG: anthranilate phosphoribosyltransferase [Actinomycetota bacterium]
METFSWPDVLGPLLEGRDLSEGQAAAAMSSIMRGEATPAQIGAFASALRCKGESVEEIVGLVRAMLEFSCEVPVAGPLLDTAGTGGDRSGTFNISTVAAIVVAGAGVRVAKHGNRAASSHCGSADLLEALGVVIDLPGPEVAHCIEEVGIGFCFAPVFHSAMRHAAGPRREVGVPTVFNILGPLANPAGAAHQALGVSDPKMAKKMAAALLRLGKAHALVYYGHDGLDEITTTTTSTVIEVRPGQERSFEVDPAEFGLAYARREDLLGGNASENAEIARRVLAGQRGPARDAVLLNAAAALVAADKVDSLAEGLPIASTALDSGEAARVLERWAEVSSRLAGKNAATGDR